MQRTSVYINRQLCDFEEIEGLPIELNLSIDKFLEVDSRLVGTQLDGGLKQLVLPATKTNAAIINGISTTSDIIIEVDGQPVFAGSVRPTETLRSYTRPKQYFLDLFGGGGSPLSELENLLLTDIDMGDLSTDSSAVTSSWTHDYASGPIIASFAPALYGRPAANDPLKQYQEHADMRPHISDTTIFNKVFESHLGYKINSTFKDTETFRRGHYMFGVGEKWERSDDVSGYEFEYTLASTLAGTPPVGLNKITYSTVVSDPNSMWDGTNHFFTAPIDGYYSFDIEYTISQGPSGGTYTMRIVTYGQGVHNLLEYNYPVSGIQVVQHKSTLPSQFYSAGQNLLILSNTVNTNVEVTAQSSIKGKLDTRTYMGADVKIETCLHTEPVKDYLKGVFHKFNLTGRFELITKQFYFEPRMSYFTSDSYGAAHAGSYARTEADGYYQRPLTAFEDWNDKIDPEEIRTKKLYPFGDNLTLGYKGGKDATTAKVLAESNSSISGLRPSTPVYAVKYPMADVATGKGDTVSLNPYFNILPNASVKGIQPGSYLPAMLPSGYKFENPLPEPTFEFPPTCGFYYGLSSNLDWNYEGTARTLPMMYQQPPQGGEYFIRNQDCISYNDTGALINSQVGENKGLASNFYYNYLQCIKHGDYVEVKVRLTPSEVFSEDFTKMKYFLDSHHILLNIKNYNPLTSQATCSFYRYTYGLTSTELTAIEAGMSTVYNTFTSK